MCSHFHITFVARPIFTLGILLMFLTYRKTNCQSPETSLKELYSLLKILTTCPMVQRLRDLIWTVSMLMKNNASYTILDYSMNIKDIYIYIYIHTMLLTSYSCIFQVVKETLRMSNVLLWFPRVALNDCTIEGKFLLLF